MTKLRPPLTTELAMTKVAALLGWPAAAEIVGRADRTIRDWSDADVRTQVSLDAAFRLDNAWIEAGGQGAPPFLTWLQTMLDLAQADAVACAARRAERIARSSAEAGEAIAAQIRAAMPGATEADRLLAARETEQSIEAMTDTLADLRQGISHD